MNDYTPIAWALLEGVSAICVAYMVLKIWPRRHYPRFFALIAGIVIISMFQVFQAPGAGHALVTTGIVGFLALWVAAHIPEQTFGALFKTEAAGKTGGGSRPKSSSMASALWLLPLGMFIGLAVSASFVVSVMVPPAYLWKWIVSSEPLHERIERALNPGEQWVALRSKEREASEGLKRTTAELAAARADLEKAQDELGKLPLNGSRSVRIHVGSGQRVAGGAIYIGVSRLPYGSYCRGNVNSDKVDKIEKGYMEPGETISVASSRAKHRVVLTGFGSEYCTFDLVKD